MTQLPQPLPTKQAFIVQIQAQLAGERLHCAGRVEHLSSGQATHFSSQSDLWTFITWVLMEPQQGSSVNPSGTSES